MNLLSHISEQLSPLRPTDTIEAAIDWLTNQKVNNLPVVESGQFLGYAVLGNLLSQTEKNVELRSIIQKGIHFPVINAKLTISDAVPIFIQTGFDTLVVCKEDYIYSGIIEKNKVFSILADMVSINSQGAIITLRISNRDFSPSELCRLAENEGCKPMGFWVTNREDNDFEVNIKVQPGKVKNVVSTYERFGYQIESVFNPDDNDEDNDNRYKVFMKYIDF